jgi:hypothetical protein
MAAKSRSRTAAFARKGEREREREGNGVGEDQRACRELHKRGGMFHELTGVSLAQSVGNYI